MNNTSNLNEEPPLRVKLISKAKLPTRFGEFKIYGFTNEYDNKEHVAIVKGSVRDAADVPLRIHSECLTGDALGSLRCDCRDQLIKSLRFIGKQKRGAVLYLRQEGRGIGLVNKIRAYELQDKGMDTYEANVALGFKADARTYEVAVDMIRALEIRSIQLLTNNPEKMAALRAGGVVLTRVPHIVEYNSHNVEYIETKREKFGHLIGEDVQARGGVMRTVWGATRGAASKFLSRITDRKLERESLERTNEWKVV